MRRAYALSSRVCEPRAHTRNGSGYGFFYFERGENIGLRKDWPVR